MMSAFAIKLSVNLCALIAVFHWSLTAANADEEHNSDENILEGLLAKYDSRILPTREGLPVKVALRTNIFDMAEQRTIHSHYTIELTVHSVWNDFRLAFNASVLDDLRLVGNKIDLIWTPDISFEEKIGIASKVTTDNKYAIISSNGDILFSQRVILTLYCDMNFRRFPFDDQLCTLPILSTAYNDEHLELSWISKSANGTLGAVTFLGDMERLHTMFQVEDYSYGKRKKRFDDSEAYDELTITFHFHRHLPYYLVRIYMPLILIVVMSFGAFWIDYRSTPARTIMATTIVLTVVTFIVSIQGSLPPTTSIRSVDIYSLSCFIFVFAALVEFAFVQTIDIQVRIIERKFRKRNALELEESNGQAKLRKRRSQSSIAPALSINADEIPELKVHGIFGKLTTSLYREHLKHREVYHVLDYYAKRVFPLTFIILNVIYFAVYSSHA